jgi:hypothetical protein
MNLIKHFCGLAALIALGFAATPAKAQQYRVLHTFWNVGDFTNATATATNLASTVTLTKTDKWTLWVVVGVTNPAAGSLALQWDCSADGTTFLTTNNPAVSGSSGFFSIPLTNSGTKIVWATNMTADSLGYWRLNWLTNSAGQSVTSIVVQAYAKPVAQ